MEILLIPSFIPEEILFSTPIIRTLADQKKTSVDILTDQKHALLFESSPFVRQVIHPDSIQGKTQQYDLMIDLQNDKKSKMDRIRSQQSIKFPKSKFKEWLFTSFQINKLPSKHLVDQYFEFLQPLEIHNDYNGLDYFIPDRDIVENDWLPETHQNGYAVFAIEGASNTQQLPIERMIELCDRINKPIILIGGKKDQKKAEEIELFFKKGTEAEEREIESLNKKASIFSACGKFNLNQEASIIENSSWVFTHENIYMHIAAAFKKQIFSIWGSTSPLFGKYPYETKFTVFENNKLKCRPCSTTGYDKCPKGHFKCMQDLTFDFYLPD